VAAHSPCAVLDDAGQGVGHCAVRLVYGVFMVWSFRFGGGWDL